MRNSVESFAETKIPQYILLKVMAWVSRSVLRVKIHLEESMFALTGTDEGPTGGSRDFAAVAARSGEGKARPLPFERFLAGSGCCASSTLRFAILKMEKTREM